MNELEAAVGPVSRRRQEVQSELDSARRQSVGQFSEAIDMELKVLVKRTLLARRPNRRPAAVGPQCAADLDQQANLRQVGLKTVFVTRPTDGKLKPTNLHLRTAQIAASLSDAAGPSAAKDFVDVDFQAAEAMRQSDFEQLTLTGENTNGRRT